MPPPIPIMVTQKFVSVLLIAQKKWPHSCSEIGPADHSVHTLGTCAESYRYFKRAPMRGRNGPFGVALGTGSEGYRYSKRAPMGVGTPRLGSRWGRIPTAIGT